MPRKTISKPYAIKPESPVTIVFIMISTIITLISLFSPEFNIRIFSCPSAATGSNPFNWKNVADYFKLFIHIFGCNGGSAVIANLTILLLLLPSVEECFGINITILMILTSSFITGVLNVCFSPVPISGATSIVCMAIIITIKLSIVKKQIPLTSIALAFLFSIEIGLSINSMEPVPTIANLAGGISASLFGFLTPDKQTSARSNSRKKEPTEK